MIQIEKSLFYNLNMLPIIKLVIIVWKIRYLIVKYLIWVIYLIELILNDVLRRWQLGIKFKFGLILRAKSILTLKSQFFTWD